ncbi:SRPBCC family protein [Noviherbaspirillum saxi]|uniref:Polyketide cyclase / dehydrase and lipid transport n=1 Tax=Noviherbaspirillum saxi TaxID=2320863 RepID=A0A3A3FPB6_9BURK|nr:SRPBCC family protein [Noviherbaspirillum saxi]RJF96345.1 hypothetical protein D3871_21665 [Noviherbaspirillum saxi]
MVHDRFEFDIPASSDVVFDAFHYHCWRFRWDSLVQDVRVIDGAPCPYVGAETENAGGGWVRGLSMRTRFVSFDRPRVAAATMIGHSFPFTSWAASMKHRPVGINRSIMIYTYTFRAGPRYLSWLLEPIVKRIFDWQTRRRFLRMQRFLAKHSGEVVQWQKFSV